MKTPVRIIKKGEDYSVYQGDFAGFLTPAFQVETAGFPPGFCLKRLPDPLRHSNHALKDLH